MGAVVEPFVVQLNEVGNPTLSYQRIHESNIYSFYKRLAPVDEELIKVMDEYSHQALAKRFGKKNKNRPAEFLKVGLSEDFKEQVVQPFLDKRVAYVLKLIQEEHGWLYINSRSGNPTSEVVTVKSEEASVHFHFKKREQGTIYYPTIRQSDLGLIKLCDEKSRLITVKPCWALVNNNLLSFSDKLDGKKLKPFLKRGSLQIPSRSEPEFYRKFIPQVLENHYVEASGFSIRKKTPLPDPVLSLSRDLAGNPAFILTFEYGDETTFYAHEQRNFKLSLDESGDTYHFSKVERNFNVEKNHLEQLQQRGLINYRDSYFSPSNPHGQEAYRPSTSDVALFQPLLDWLKACKIELEASGFTIYQSQAETQFYVGTPELVMDLSDNPKDRDWFDVQARVYFGNYSIPFLWLKPYIEQGIREYPLPSGEVALLPESWFSQYSDLFEFLSVTGNEDILHLRKHHYRLLEGEGGNGKALNNGSYIEALRNLEAKEEENKPLPSTLNVTLRDYQRTGYNWLMFLREQGFGGCLADDMGLGKTLQTLAVLLKDKEETEALADDQYQRKNKGRMNLVIMPASLLHNWRAEILKFTPQLSCLVYTGNDRGDLIRWFEHYDVILTTYGLARNDRKLLERYQFNYIILDESQVIKNPSSKSASTVKQLNTRYRLVLTGTPIENSLIDLWSQMAFLNPGLLGSYRFFKKTYVIPIEKSKDEATRDKLRVLIKPFLLRRTKEEISEELPELTEKTHYCIMNDAQQQEYDRIKSYYRNQILGNVDYYGLKQSQFMILRGITQLRLASNHPQLVNNSYDCEASKFEEILQKVAELAASNHKILVFSQFVRHLNFLKASLDQKSIGYAMLTGSAKNREAIIQDFRQDPDKPVFLISLKAGGVGLNLVEADYVFIADPWWNPATESQAINRAHRIGQDKRVIAYKFITKGTIEEKILKLQEEKSELVKEVIQTNQQLSYQLTRDDVEMLLE